MGRITFAQGISNVNAGDYSVNLTLKDAGGNTIATGPDVPVTVAAAPEVPVFEPPVIDGNG